MQNKVITLLSIITRNLVK